MKMSPSINAKLKFHSNFQEKVCALQKFSLGVSIIAAAAMTLYSDINVQNPFEFSLLYSIRFAKKTGLIPANLSRRLACVSGQFNRWKFKIRM